MEAPSIKVLLVEDDEDDFIAVQKYLSNVRTVSFEVEWASTYSTAMNAMESGNGKQQWDLHQLNDSRSS